MCPASLTTVWICPGKTLVALFSETPHTLHRKNKGLMMLLNSHHRLYVWNGRKSPVSEQRVILRLRLTVWNDTMMNWKLDICQYHLPMSILFVLRCFYCFMSHHMSHIWHVLQKIWNYKVSWKNVRWAYKTGKWGFHVNLHLGLCTCHKRLCPISYLQSMVLWA